MPFFAFLVVDLCFVLAGGTTQFESVVDWFINAWLWFVFYLRTLFGCFFGLS